MDAGGREMQDMLHIGLGMLYNISCWEIGRTCPGGTGAAGQRERGADLWTEVSAWTAR